MTKHVVCFIVFFAFVFSSGGQVLRNNKKSVFVKLEGCVTDNNGNPMSVVQVKGEGSDFMTVSVTNVNGYFSIRLPKGKSRLTFSHVGFDTVIRDVKSKNGEINQVDVTLSRTPILLDEIVVNGNHKMTAKDLIDQVAANLSRTMISKPYTSDGFVRRIRKRNGKYVCFAESVIDHYNGGYPSRGHAYTFVKPKEFRISDQDTSVLAVTWSFFPHPRSCVYPEVLLPLKLKDYYNFECVDTLVVGGARKVLINYQLDTAKANPDAEDGFSGTLYRNNHQYGQLYICLSDLSVESIENKGKSPEGEERVEKAEFCKVRGLSFIKTYHYQLVYTENSLFSDEKLHLSQDLYFEFSNFDTTAISTVELAKRFRCEVNIDRWLGTETRWCSFVANEYDRSLTYHAEFWDGRPTVTDWMMVKQDLEELSGKSLEVQFEENGYFIVTESVFNYMRRNRRLSREARQRLGGYYRENKKFDFFKRASKI